MLSRNSIIDLVFRVYLCDEVNTIKDVEIGDILEFLDMIEYYQKHLLYKSKEIKVIKLDETITEIEWIVNNLNNENNFYTSHLMKQLEKLKEIRSLL